MNVLCVDQDRTKLRQMKRDAKEIVPDARIAACRDPSRAERLAREKGCDVLLTNTVFDGSNWDGVMLARKIQSVCPRANIIFIADRADTTAAYDAWQIGASAFLLRPYEKQRLGKGIGRPALCVGMSAPVCNYIKHAAI